MSSTQVGNDTATEASAAAAVPLRIEVVVIPVADVDRAKSFYQGLGWRLDADVAGGDGGLGGGFYPGTNGRAYERVAAPHDWWDWYAAYMVAREDGSGPDDASAAAGRYMADVRHVVVPSAK
jgi:catechol 2,3-dioxygenase-like lactoylglutathione lyase family enzyme